MKTWLGTCRSTVLFVLVAGLGYLVDAQGQEQLWVKGAWVTVRSYPSPDAAVSAHWVTNTRVRVEAREGNWCHARLEGEDVTYGGGAEMGYVACDALGQKRLTFADLSPQWTNEHEILEASARAFWIAPSISRFAQFGLNLNYFALAATEDESEKKAQIPIRFAIPQFNAMKQLLERGVVPVEGEVLSRIAISNPKPDTGSSDWMAQSEIGRHLQTFEPSRNLPPVKPSAFASHADVVLVGEAGVDAISAMQGKANRVEFRGKPQWISGHHDEGVVGYWDIGEINVWYSRPAILYSVSSAGLVGAKSIQSAIVKPPSPADGCEGGYPPLPDGAAVSGYPRIFGQPLISFFLPQVLAAKKLDVISRKVRLTIHGDPYSGPKHPEPTSVLVHAIDINNDRVPDLAVFEWSAIGLISGEISLHRYQFVNVGGDWWYVGYESAAECT